MNAETETQVDTRPDIPSPIVEVQGKQYMQNAKGALVPLETIRTQDQLEDGMVRKVIAFAEDLNAQIGRFRRHCYADIGAYLSLLEQEYQTNPVGPKGNVSFTSFDGCLKVTVQVSELIRFGPELESARALVDECLADWSADAKPEIRAIIDRAFSSDASGEVRQANLFALLRLDIDDARWQRAMGALRDAIRVIGSKEYIRFYRRKAPSDAWEAVTIDLAKAGAS